MPKVEADTGGDESAELHRLRRALQGTAELPRPFAHVKLPLRLGELISEKAIARLRPSAVLIAVLMRDGLAQLLLTRRSESLRQHKGQISFPGGSRDVADRTLAATALREAQEEIGLDPAQVEIIGFLDDYPTFTGFRITPVVARVRGGFEPITDAGEVAEVFELPLNRVLEPGAFESKILSREGLNIPFYELNHGRHRIWGATAGILWELRHRMLTHA